MPTEGSSNEPEPQSVVEIRNPAFVGSRHEERSVRSVSLRTASGSFRSSTTASSSESQHTCPSCHKIVEILPATPHMFPSDFCRCNKPLGPPSSIATDEPVSEATLQDAPIVADDDSTSRSAHSLTSGNLPPADQPVEREEQVPPPALRFVPAGLRRYLETRHWCIYFGVFSFVIIGVIIIIIILAYFFSSFDSSSGDSEGVTIRGRPRKN